MKLLTNNSAFLNYDKKNIEVDYRDTDYLGILKIARDYVHENYRILTHPLYGSVKPNETVYRSVVLVEGDLTDTDSVVLLASAIETFEKFKGNRKTPAWIERVKEDFSVIDYDLITNAIERIIK